MNKKKIMIIAIVLVVIIALVLGLVYLFVLKGETGSKIQRFEDIYDGEATEALLENELEVKFTYFATWFNMRRGVDEPRLRVDLTSKSSETKSFSVEMAAINKETGEVMDTDTIEVENLEPGITETVDFFTYIEKDLHKTYLAAEYKIVKVTSK